MLFFCTMTFFKLLLRQYRLLEHYTTLNWHGNCVNIVIYKLATFSLLWTCRPSWWPGCAPLAWSFWAAAACALRGMMLPDLYICLIVFYFFLRVAAVCIWFFFKHCFLQNPFLISRLLRRLAVWLGTALIRLTGDEVLVYNPIRANVPLRPAHRNWPGAPFADRADRPPVVPRRLSGYGLPRED